MYGFHFIQMTSLIGAVVFVDGQALYENKCINHEHYGMFYICSHHITNTQTHTYTYTVKFPGRTNPSLHQKTKHYIWREKYIYETSTKLKSK